MDDPIAESYHCHHRLTEGCIKVASIDQEAIHVAVFLRMAQLVDRDDVGCNVRAALDSGLEDALYRQLASEVTLERL
jgi:hypothetical protein